MPEKILVLILLSTITANPHLLQRGHVFKVWLLIHCFVMEDILLTGKGDLLVIKMVYLDCNIGVREILVLSLVKILQEKKNPQFVYY